MSVTSVHFKLYEEWSSSNIIYYSGVPTTNNKLASKPTKILLKSFQKLIILHNERDSRTRRTIVIRWEILNFKKCWMPGMPGMGWDLSQWIFGTIVQ